MYVVGFLRTLYIPATVAFFELSMDMMCQLIQGDPARVRANVEMFVETMASK